MKNLIFLAVCTVLLASKGRCQSTTEEELYQLLAQSKYKQLVNKVCALREKEYYKNAFMDYCLAYGYCQLDKPSLAEEWFNHILDSYNSLTMARREELNRLKQDCAGAHATPQTTDALFGYLRAMSSDGFRPNAGVESKMGIPSLDSKVEEFDFEHLTFDTQNRKFTLQQKKEAQKYYQKLIANPTIKVITTNHFLVFYSPNASAINEHMNQLEKYYSYYITTFNLQESNRLITIFYCTNRTDFTVTAKRVHNIPVPSSTYGYASGIDLVMLGIASTSWLGAMKHELFHIMIRSYVGDIPPWLDEGVACYFESSTLNDNTATTNLSGSNYRIRLMQFGVRNGAFQLDNGDKIILPPIKQLTNFNWLEYSGKPGDLLIKATLNQSLGYAFVSFLQERGLLEKTIDAFRNRSYKDPSSGNGSDSLTILHLRSSDELLTNVTGLEFNSIQTQFDQWCKNKNIIRR